MTDQERIEERYYGSAELVRRSYGRGRPPQFRVRIAGVGETGWHGSESAAWAEAVRRFLQ